MARVDQRVVDGSAKGENIELLKLRLETEKDKVVMMNEKCDSFKYVIQI